MIQVGNGRRAATLQEVEDYFHLRSTEEDIDDLDVEDEGNGAHPTQAQIELWLGSDPAGTRVDDDAPADPDQPTLLEQLSASQKEFAVLALGGAPDMHYLSGRAGFGKSPLPGISYMRSAPWGSWWL